MKLTKPFNQRKNVLQRTVNWSGYRFLSIFMAALLFCGMNSQLLAASVPSGVNIDSNNNTPASGDKFNSESFLQASNPNDDANQHWTWGEEIGAGILGAALLGGVVAGGYKCYVDRKARNEEWSGKAQERRERTSTDGVAVSGDDAPRGIDLSGVTEKTDQAENIPSNNNAINETAPGWRERVAQVFSPLGRGLASLGRGLASLGQKTYDLVTLKSCWPAKAVAEKSVFDRLTEARTAQLKTALADRLAQRPFLTKIYDLFALTQHALPSDQTARQKNDAAMAALGGKPITQLTAAQLREHNMHLNAKDQRAKDIAALTPDSTTDEMYATMDPETAEALDNTTASLKGPGVIKNAEEEKRLIYFVAKNPDIHPGHIEAMEKVLSQRNEESELKGKLIGEIQHCWDGNRTTISSQEEQPTETPGLPSSQNASQGSKGKGWFSW